MDSSTATDHQRLVTHVGPDNRTAIDTSSDVTEFEETSSHVTQIEEDEVEEMPQAIQPPAPPAASLRRGFSSFLKRLRNPYFYLLAIILFILILCFLSLYIPSPRKKHPTVHPEP